METAHREAAITSLQEKDKPPGLDDSDEMSSNSKKFSWRGLLGDCPATANALDEAFKAKSSRGKRAGLWILQILDCTGRNFGQVCFANNPISGYFIVIGLAVGSPIVALSGLVASTVGVLFALLMGQPQGSLNAGLVCYNAALLGAVMPALLLGPGSSTDPAGVWLCVIIGAAVTVLMSSSVGNCFGSLKPAMPLFTLPFNLVGLFSIVCLRVHQPPELNSPSAATSSPIEPLNWSNLWLGSLLGVGQVFAVQDVGCSILVLIGLLPSSPILTVTAFLGSVIGTFMGAAVSPSLYEIAYAGILGYNAILASCAVCFFFVPSWRSALVGLLNAILATAVQIALGWGFSDVHLPVLTLPFVGASLLILTITSVNGTKDSLPRPAALTYPEQHLIQARRARSNRGDSVNSDTSQDSNTDLQQV